MGPNKNNHFFIDDFSKLVRQLKSNSCLKKVSILMLDFSSHTKIPNGSNYFITDDKNNNTTSPKQSFITLVLRKTNIICSSVIIHGLCRSLNKIVPFKIINFHLIFYTFHLIMKYQIGYLIRPLKLKLNNST